MLFFGSTGHSPNVPERAYGDVALAIDSTTYLDQVLRARDDIVTRWHDRRARPVSVWIQPRSAVRVAAVREAVESWDAVELPIRFRLVSDSAEAEVHVTWVDRFREPISGKTLWSHDDRGWITEADIVLAERHRAGDALDARATHAIALHEIGHVVGLDHTTVRGSIMTALVQVEALAPIDLATARALYAAPAGRRRLANDD
jgi:hypothetical protein